MTENNQFLETISDIMGFIAPNAGGSIPSEDSDEYNTWLTAIQVKYEEASRRGFWRRLLTKDTISLTVDDEDVLLPTRFQRANSLYIFAVDGVDWADPDREPDDQSVFAQMITDYNDNDFGNWQLNFQTPIAETDTATIWYFATPPKPTESTDKVLLPGDMIAFGAMSEIFRTTNLEGSQDDARIEYENRMETYLGIETIPSRNDILKFQGNPRGWDYTARAKNQYANRPGRTGGS